MEQNYFIDWLRRGDYKLMEDKKLRESENRVKLLIKQGTIKTKEKPEYTEFFLKNAEDSINSARALFEISVNPEKQKHR